MRRHRWGLRRGAVGLVAAALALGAAGCGSSDDDPDTTAPATTSSSASTPTPSATPTPTPTATTPALSRFEGDPAVVAARLWAKAIAKDVNNKDKAYKLAGRVSTKKAQGYMGDFEDEDIDKGYAMPGPIPFTPIRVVTAGNTARIASCVWAHGWGQKNGLPGEKREIRPNDFRMKKVGGVWKFDDLVKADYDCSDVPVKGTPG